MTTTDGDSLLKSILAHPDDDTVRLVYADWLEENEEEARAEFIRVQVEITKPHPIVCDRCGNKLVRQPMSSVPDLSRCLTCSMTRGPFWEEVRQEVRAREKAEARESALLDANRERWLGQPFVVPCPDCVHWRGRMPKDCRCKGTRRVLSHNVVFRRGFPDEVQGCRLQDVLERIHDGFPDDDGWQPTPWLQSVVRHHPTVQQIPPVDRKPYSLAAGRFMWSLSDNPQETPLGYLASLLPLPLWQLAEPGGRGVTGWESEAKAVEVLARAVVTFTRDWILRKAASA
jgi:uncharacterized protein (TIGR02996 family)